VSPLCPRTPEELVRDFAQRLAVKLGVICRMLKKRRKVSHKRNANTPATAYVLDAFDIVEPRYSFAVLTMPVQQLKSVFKQWRSTLTNSSWRCEGTAATHCGGGSGFHFVRIKSAAGRTRASLNVHSRISLGHVRAQPASP